MSKAADPDNSLAELYHTEKNTFRAGNPGRPKGSRNKMTQRMLDRVAERQEAGLSAEEILIDIMQDPNQPPELRFKAASKIADIVYPKAAAVEVDIEDNRLSISEIDDKIKQLLTINQN